MGTLNNRCRIVIGTQKGTIILTTTHMTAKRTASDLVSAPHGKARNALLRGLNKKRLKPKKLLLATKQMNEADVFVLDNYTFDDFHPS